MLRIEQDILDIEHFDSRGSSALSLYLDTDSSRGAGRNLDAQLTDALREVPEWKGPPNVRDAIREAADRAMGGIDKLWPVPRAAAAFACPEQGFLRVVPLPDPVERSAHWGPRLRVEPLVAALDEHERTVVVLVDEAHAHVYRIFMGQITETATLERTDEGHAQRGRSQRKSLGGSNGVGAWMGYGESNLQRRHDWHVRLHLERTIEAMHVSSDRLLVGGVPETAHELWRMLPRRLKGRARLIRGIVVGASPAQVLARVSEIQGEVEREEEKELLDNLLERDHARSAFGAAAVAEAASDGRVHTLVYAAGTELSGAECPACGWLLPGTPPGSCPRCGEALEGPLDMVERLVSRVIRSGGRVEEVRGAAQAPLQKSEGLAALLRFVPGA